MSPAIETCLTQGEPATRSLASQQAALLAALWAPRPAQALPLLGDHAVAGPLRERGLRAYRSNGRALAQRALAAAYPAIAALLGPENFEALAHRHWLEHPPTQGDIGVWGGALERTITGWTDLAAEEPYLADVARLEWALHACATAADAEADLASFALLTAADAGTVTLRLAPGCCCLASPWPIASIVLSQTEGEPTPATAGELLRAGTAQTALVWRQGWRPRVRVAGPMEALFIAALQERRPLADALQAAPGFGFDTWLAPAVQSGLVLGAVRP